MKSGKGQTELIIAIAIVFIAAALIIATQLGLGSETPTGKAILDPPTGLNAVPGTNPGEIDLSWTASSGAEYYAIEIYSGPYHTWRGTSSTSYTHDVELDEAREWTFQVYACNSDCSETSAGSEAAFSYPKIGVNINGPYLGIVGEQIQLNSTTEYAADIIYDWSITSNPANCSLDNSAIPTPIITCSSTGESELLLQITANNNDTTEDTTTTNISEAPQEPPIPQNVTASVSIQPGIVFSPGDILIEWDETQTAEYYEIDWSADTYGGTITNIQSVDVCDTGCIYMFSTTTPSDVGLIHNFVVRACNAVGCSGNSAEVSSYPKIGVQINAPAEAQIGTDIDLTSTAEYISSTSTPAYSWFFGSSATDCTFLTPTDQSSVTITCPTTGSILMNLSLTGANNSDSSNDTASITISDTQTPPVPQNVDAVPGLTNAGQVRLTWDQLGITLQGEHYEIEWNAGPHQGSHNAVVTVWNHDTPYLPTETPALHYYEVRRCDDTTLICSNWSTQVSSYPRIGVEAGGPYSGDTGQNISLNGNAEYTVSPSYSWSITNNPSNCTLNGSTTLNPTINCSTQGTRTIELTITDSQNMTAQDSTQVTVTEEADDISPTIQITNPSDNQTVNETILIQATATDNIGIKNVKFFIDNTLKTTDNSSPFEYDWNTLKESNASHSIKAIAEDAAGNTAQTQITVTVNNGSSGAECGNGVIEIGEECEIDSQCYSLPRGKCNTTTKKHESRSVTCNSCSCVAGNWTETSLYCDVCNHCGDEEQNCDETAATCPADFGGAIDEIPPEKPTGLEAIRTTENSITIQWNQNTEEDLKRYKIYFQKTGGIKQETIATKNETELTLTALETATQYFISMTAIDSSGNTSEHSNEISATTKGTAIEVPAPTNLTAKYTKEKVLLEWTHTTPKPDYYIIQRKIKDEAFDQIKTTSGNSYEDTETEKDKTYIYRIAAFKNNKTSNYSEEVEITTTKELKCTENNVCEEGCEADPDCDNWLPWAIAGAIVVVSTALAYIFFTFDI